MEEKERDFFLKENYWSAPRVVNEELKFIFSIPMIDLRKFEYEDLEEFNPLREIGRLRDIINPPKVLDVFGMETPSKRSEGILENRPEITIGRNIFGKQTELMKDWKPKIPGKKENVD